MSATLGPLTPITPDDMTASDREIEALIGIGKVLNICDAITAASIDSERIEVAAYGDARPGHISRYGFWRCHYCGSVHSCVEFRCKSCGGERRI